MTITKLIRAIARCQTKAFTLLESLCVLFLLSFLLLSLSTSVKGIFARVQEELFFLSFEQLYRQTQRLAISRQQEMLFSIDQEKISNQDSQLKLPAGLMVDKAYQLKISQTGGNSSLSKIIFSSQHKTVTYQLYIGSGNYKKMER